MNTDLEDRLRADMARFTQDVRVPPGLMLKACQHGRRRRIRLRVAIAAGTTAVLAASAAAVAGVSGALTSAPAPPVQTTAYILKQVDSALAPSNVANMISVTRVVYTPVERFKPTVQYAGPPSLNLSPVWTVAYSQSWQYQNINKESDYGPNGQRVFDVILTTGPVVTPASRPTVTQTAVLYNDRTWWTASWLGIAPAVLARLRNSATGRLFADGWPALIRHDLSTGMYKMAGHQVVDGIDTIKLTTGGQYALTLWVNPVTFLPVRFDASGMQTDYQWLAPTAAHLALLNEPIPPGFRQVPPTQQ
jgi:hypothetical protein